MGRRAASPVRPREPSADLAISSVMLTSFSLASWQPEKSSLSTQFTFKYKYGYTSQVKDYYENQPETFIEVSIQQVTFRADQKGYRTLHSVLDSHVMK